MRKQWITAVGVVGVALATTASAWADCDNQAQLCPTGGCTLTGASGQAEGKFTTANPLLRIKGANEFEGNIQGLKALNAYTMTGFDALGKAVAVVVFGTDASGAADADVKNLAGQSACSIKTVSVTQFGSKTTVLRGTFGVGDNPPEVEVELQNEVQAEAQLELNHIVNP